LYLFEVLVYGCWFALQHTIFDPVSVKIDRPPRLKRVVTPLSI
jgi:hypothetical protein